MKKILIKILRQYLKFWAFLVIKSRRPEIIGITGSVGKTSTKEAVFAVLKSGLPNKFIARSIGNLNSELGLPLSILRFSKTPSSLTWIFIIFAVIFKAIFYALKIGRYPEILVLEYGPEKPEDMSFLISCAQPKIAVITWIGQAHYQYYESQDKIALEKAKLVRSLPEDGTAILNLDNSFCQKIAPSLHCQVLTFSLKGEADFEAKNIMIDFDKTSFEFTGKKFTLFTFGKSSVYSALAATAVGSVNKIPIEKIKEALASLKPFEGRGQILKGMKNSVIIDDTYNANPTSMVAALDNLKEIKASGDQDIRKIAVLGDMLELGSITQKSHQEIGELAKKSADLVIAVGPNSKEMKASKWFADSLEASQYLVKEIRENDIILVKGSRGMRMEKIVEALIKE